MALPADVRKRLLAVGLAASAAAAEFVTITPPRETLYDIGAFWTVWSETETRPFPRFELRLDAFDTGTNVIPKSDDVLLEWLGAYDGNPGTGYHVTVGAGSQTQLPAYWQSRPLAYAGRLCGPLSRLKLGWTSGQPIYPRAAIGGPGVGSDNFIAWGTPGVWGETIGPLLIEAADPDEKPQIQDTTILSTYGAVEGLVFKDIEFTNGEGLGGEPQPYILIPDGQDVGQLGFVNCYIKPRPFNWAGSSGARFGAKWGVRVRSVKGLFFENCNFGNEAEDRYFEEHCIYASNNRRWAFIINCTGATTQRTFCQFVDRQTDAPFSFPDMGASNGPILVYGVTYSGSAWDTGSGAGSAFTFAPHKGPVYIENCTIPAKPAYNSGFQERGGAVVYWWGGGATGTPDFTITGAVLPDAEGKNTWFDADGFGGSKIYVGPNNFDVSNPGGVSRKVLNISNVREVAIYVGPGQNFVTVEDSGTPTIGLDHSQNGTGNAGAVPTLQYNDGTVTFKYEAQVIRFFGTYTQGSVPPGPGAGANWDIAASGWTVQKPSGDGITGTFVTSLPWNS